MRVLNRALVVGLLVLLVTVTGRAAGVAVQGTIVDPLGFVIPGARVDLLSGTRVTAKAVSGYDGAFRFDVEGEYVVFGSEHRDACSKCCLHRITEAIVPVPDAGECGKRTVATAIYDGCCQTKPLPIGKYVRGKVVDNCKSMLEDVCVLLLKDGQPVESAKTISGSYRFDNDGDTVVFCPEVSVGGRDYRLLTPTLVALPCPDREGLREAPAAIYSGNCMHEQRNPNDPTPPRDRKKLNDLSIRWKTVDELTKRIKQAISQSDELVENDRREVGRRLEEQLGAIARQTGALKAQQDTSGQTDSEFVRGSEASLLRVVSALSKIAATAEAFSKRGGNEARSAAEVFKAFHDELLLLNREGNR